MLQKGPGTLLDLVPLLARNWKMLQKGPGKTVKLKETGKCCKKGRGKIWKKKTTKPQPQNPKNPNLELIKYLRMQNSIEKYFGYIDILNCQMEEQIKNRY